MTKAFILIRNDQGFHSDDTDSDTDEGFHSDTE